MSKVQAIEFNSTNINQYYKLVWYINKLHVVSLYFTMKKKFWLTCKNITSLYKNYVHYACTVSTLHLMSSILQSSKSKRNALRITGSCLWFLQHEAANWLATRSISAPHCMGCQSITVNLTNPRTQPGQRKALWEYRSCLRT